MVQALDRRLFVRLQAFTGAGEAADLLSALKEAGAEGVVYESVIDPQGLAVVVVSEDADALTTTTRRLAADAASLGCVADGELSMFGRTYGSGREPQLEDWLVHAPRRKLAAAEAGWTVWYPLRRTGAYYRLPPADQGRILAEHGKLGAIFGQAGYGNDVRLDCFGLDRDNSEFVIGLLGPRLDALSRLVKAMRGNEQTAEYIERLGPFFVGRRAGHTIADQSH